MLIQVLATAAFGCLGYWIFKKLDAENNPNAVIIGWVVFCFFAITVWGVG